MLPAPDITTNRPRRGGIVAAVIERPHESGATPGPLNGPSLRAESATTDTTLDTAAAEAPSSEAEALPNDLNSVETINGRPAWNGRPIIYVKDEIMTIVQQATADLGRLGVFSSVDFRLVKASENGARLVYLSKGILYALLETASHYWSNVPPKKVGVGTTKTLPDGSRVEIKKESFVSDGVRTERTTKVKDGRVVEQTDKQEEVFESIVAKEDPPQRVVDAIFERGEYPELHELRGVRAFPFGRPDGTLVLVPGFDATSGYIFAPTRPVSLPADLSLAAAQKAAASLLELYGDFPLTPAGVAGLLAFNLAVPMRPALDIAPFIGVDSPTPASGKGKLVTCVSIAGSGGMPASIPHRRNPEEQEKTFASALREGAAVTCLDNAAAAVGGSTFDSVMTAPNGETRLRLLGASQLERVSTKTTIVVTGNNLKFLGDTNRRALVIRLDPGVERPQERTGFKHSDLEKHFQDNVYEINTLILIILESFRLAGRPQTPATPWGFPKWDYYVRACVLWLGYEDPCLCRVTDADQDPDIAFLAAVFPVIARADTKGTGISSQELISKLGDAAVLDAFKTLSGSVNVAAFGTRLDKFHGRVVGGMKLLPRKISGGVAKWRVARVEAPAAAEPPN